MSKLTETLKNNGWVETTLGECRLGEEVVIVDNGHVRHEFITRADEVRGTVSDARGFLWAAERPALRSPRPEYAPGTVALITWDGQDKPMRAMRLNQDWTTVDNGYVLEGSAKVVRVLLPADQDTPPVEVTDEMAADALASLRIDANLYLLNDNWSHLEVVRDALKAALGVEK